MTREQQCEMVRAWCKQNGVCPPAEGFEWLWYGRVVVAYEDSPWRKLPPVKARRGIRTP